MGTGPTQAEISDLMTNYGFKPINNTNSRGWFRRSDSLLVCDAHGSNFVKQEHGGCFPIDLPIGHVSPELAEIIIRQI
jgi:hypothetical protein